MKISSVLNRSGLVYSTKPYLLIDTANNDIEGNNDDTTSIVTYQEAIHKMKLYRNWIFRQLEEALMRASGSSSSNVEIILAFLSVNSPELVLAIMAALDIYALSSTSFSSSKKIITFRTAMLNARWTPQEIAAVLRVPSSDSSHSFRTSLNRVQQHTHHVTMLLYGDGFDNVAKGAIDIIAQLDIEQNHTALYAPIPALKFLPKQFPEHSVPTSSKSRNEPLFGWSDVEHDNNSWLEDAIIIFTSGTTSTYIPKGVRLSHASLLVQSMAKLMPPCSYDCKTSLLGETVPFFHVGGLSSMIAIIMAGGSIVFSRKEKKHGQPFSSFLPINILKTIEQSHHKNNIANTLVVVPAMLHSLIEKSSPPCATKYNNVRLIVVGGSNASLELLQQTRAIFPHAKIVQTYACSEAGSSITFVDVTVHKTKSGVINNKRSDLAGQNVGYPPPHIEIRLLSQNSNGSLNGCTWIAQPYEIGLICTRGLHIMNGYWRRCGGVKNVEENNRGLQPFVEGWLKTEDMGYLDENGELYFCGRANDIIRTGGETVFPMEVEHVLSVHNGIDSCAVIGLPDDRLGEIVCVAVVPKVLEGTKSAPSLQIEDLRQHCKNHNLAGYKCPRAAFIVTEIPRNHSGKILKNKLVSDILLLREDSKKKVYSKL